MNPAASNYGQGEAPKEQIASIRKVGTDLDHKIIATAADGSKISSRIIIPIADGQGRVFEAPDHDGVTVKWFERRELEITYRNGSKVVNTVRSRISTNGKHMYADSEKVNELGDITQHHVVYDRQELSNG